MIKDVEYESGERYIRVSIMDEDLTEEEKERIFEFLEAVVYQKRVPYLSYKD